jgi:hypothetical protein
MIRVIQVKSVSSALVLVALVMSVSACNTTKATFDTFAKFTSSTSPEDYFNADGLVKESKKAQLFTAVVFENLEQNIAQGHGEYLTSLAILLKVPAAEQEEFRTRSQSQYPLLFASDRRTAEGLLSMLSNNREAH